MINDALQSMMVAVESGRTDVIQNVVNTVQKCEENDEGIDLTVSNLFRSECGEYGTILHYAAAKENRDCVRTLLSLGAYPSCQNGSGQTALQMTQDEGTIAVFNEQLLHNIAQRNLEKVEELLDAGVDVNCLDSKISQNTPLHWAATYGSVEIVQLLLDDGARVNALNGEGCTPLHDAVARGDTAIVEVLMKHDADPEIKAHSGKLLGKMARDIASDFIKQLLTSTSSPSQKLAPLILPNNASTNVDSGTMNGTAPFSTPTPTTSGIDTKQLTASVLKLNLEKSVEVGSVTSEQSSLINGQAEEYDEQMNTHREQLKMVWPTPQIMKLLSGMAPFKPADRIIIAVVNGPNPKIVHDILDAWRAKRQSFLDLHIEFIMETIAYQTTPAVVNFELPSIICQVDEKLFKHRESYKLTVLEKQIRVTASDLAGLHYALSTFIQLLEIFDKEEEVPCLQIYDWPDFTCRGVLLDVSQGRIPQEANLWELLDRLSILKLNEAHLYTRFKAIGAERENPDIWQFPYSRSLLVELDRFCSQRFITLVPVLDISPSVTCENLVSLCPVFSDYLSCFTNARKINIGPRLSSLLLNINESGFLSTTHFLPLSDSHTILLCGEALKQSEDLQKALMWLPSNMVIMTYGYNADHDFTTSIRQYAQIGCSFCVCPGTAAWNSIGGCPQAAIQNINAAVQQGHQYQSLGIVVCDWSGHGHVTDNLIALPSLVAAAGMAWNKETDTKSVVAQMGELLNLHMLVDQKKIIGQAIMDLGDLESYLLRESLKLPENNFSGIPGVKGSFLFQLLVKPNDVNLTHLTPTHFQRALKTIRTLQTRIIPCELQCYQGREYLAAFKNILEIAMTACRIGQHLASSGRNPGTPDGIPLTNIGVTNLHITAKTDLANRLLALKAGYKSSWLTRNLPDGFETSENLLFSLISHLLPSQKVIS